MAAQRHRYKTTELIVSLLIIMAVMAIGILFVRQIDQSNGKLLRAWLEMRAARDEAQQASRAKSDFVSRMSHELRTPLNAILGFTQLLDREGLTFLQNRYIREINIAGSHLLDLINQILDLAKIEAGRLVLERIPFPVTQAIDEVVSLIKGRARTKGLAVKVSISPALPDWIQGDPVRIRQVLINLLGNALKFTEQGEIGIRVYPLEPQEDTAKPTLRFEIWDTGIGLDSSAVERLFQPFTQADESTTRKYGGTGLGLRICKELVEAMGGSLQVESSVGQGSLFWFVLPLEYSSEGLSHPTATINDRGAEATDGPIQRAGTDVPSERTSNHMTDGRLSDRHYCGHVLVVEDNPVNQLVASSMLESLGLTCDIANNGLEALEKFQQRTYNLVFMDVEMPVMDGYVATREIRLREKQTGKGPIPVIAMTANALAEDRDHCLANGMDEHLAKPVRMAALADVIQRWLPLAATV